MNRLILALIICCGLTACDNNGTKKSASTDVEQAQQLEQKDHVEVLYFHGKQAVRHLYGNRKERQRSGRGTICQRIEKRNSRF